MPFRVTACEAGAQFAISLPANAAEDRGAEGRRLTALDGELLQIEPHLRGNFGRDIRIGDLHLREIAARHLVARIPSSSSQARTCWARR